jgi:DNA-directed RNA polymerase II subunit RPB9
MEFCKNCNNYLYIKEDTEQRKIFSYCKLCNYQKETIDTCIFKKKYKKSDSHPHINHQYMNEDPTYPRMNTKCSKCKTEGSNAYYQCKNLSIVIVCANCHHNWKFVGTKTRSTNESPVLNNNDDTH